MTTMLAARLIQGVRTAATIYPRRVTEQCRYFNRCWNREAEDILFKPLCIVGHAIHMAYPENSDRIHQLANGASIEQGIKTGRLEIVGSKEQLDWLERVQAWQDTDNPWEMSVFLADNPAPDTVEGAEEVDVNVFAATD